MHIHDVYPAVDTHTLPYYGGCGDWDKITKALKEIGYAGDFTLEASNFNRLLPKELVVASTNMAEVGRYFVNQIVK